MTPTDPAVTDGCQVGHGGTVLDKEHFRRNDTSFMYNPPRHTKSSLQLHHSYTGSTLDDLFPLHLREEVHFLLGLSI